MQATSKKAVALLSGGLDSSIALAISQRENWEIVLAVHFQYGQRAAVNEYQQAEKIAQNFGVPFRAIELPWFKELAGRGALIADYQELPHPKMEDLSNPEWTAQSAKTVWVPNRNGIFIEIAGAFAESAQADAIIVGFNREEAETFPDNSVEYLTALSLALSYSTSNQVQIFSPTAKLDKLEIVREAKQLRFPFELLWSCYDSGEKMCGRCESCMRLKRALHANEVPFDGFFANAHLR